MRRLPIYFVLDCSESMVGEPIAAVEKGLVTMLGILRKDPYALETAYVSVITFGSAAKQVVPLTELCQFHVPKLVLGSGTSMGAALELLERQIASEVVKSTTEVKGDYKPLVFLLTDGEPTDRWEGVADRLKKNRSFQLIAVGCGPDANPGTLRRMAELVILGEEANQDTFAQFFRWVSASVATASQAVDKTGESNLNLDKFPQENSILKVVNESTPQSEVVPNRFVFLHCRCTKTKKFYLIKFVRGSEKTGGFWGMRGKPQYQVVASYPLDDFEQISEGTGISVSVEQLGGIAPCPYCGNAIAAHCECGKLQCCPEFSRSAMTLTCPWCSLKGNYGGGGPGGFNVGGGGG